MKKLPPQKLPGRIYKKHNKRPDGTVVEHSTWTVRYKGKDHATHETDPAKARQFLINLMGTGALVAKPRPWAAGLEPDPDPERGALMRDLFKSMLKISARLKQSSYYDKCLYVTNHLGPFFDRIPAKELTSGLLGDYTDLRIAEGAKASTVNRELSTLGRSLKIARDESDPPLIQRYPKIVKLEESAPRKGFLSHDQYMAMKASLQNTAPHLVPIFCAGYFLGNRVGELRQIELADIDIHPPDGSQPQYRLYSDATKTKQARVVPLYGDVLRIFQEQIAEPRPDGCTWLFHYQGEPIQSFYKAWNRARKAAGLDGFLFHDLRRTTVRNLRRATIDRPMAMKITGHKTENVFERYNIIDEADMVNAADKATAYMEKLNDRYAMQQTAAAEVWAHNDKKVKARRKGKAAAA